MKLIVILGDTETAKQIAKYATTAHLSKLLNKSNKISGITILK